MKWVCFWKWTFSKTLIVLLVHWGKDKKCDNFQEEKRFSSWSTTAKHHKKYFCTSTNFLSLAASTQLLLCIDKNYCWKWQSGKMKPKMKKGFFHKTNAFLFCPQLENNKHVLGFAKRGFVLAKPTLFLPQRAMNLHELPLLSPASVAKIACNARFQMTNVLTSQRLGIWLFKVFWLHALNKRFNWLDIVKNAMSMH